MLRKKAAGIGLALHASAIELVHVPEGKAEAQKNALVERILLSADDYDNGYVKNAERFAAQLKQTFQRLGWRRWSVTLALPSSVSVLRPLLVPKMKKPKLAPVIQYQIGKAIALPFSNAAFDFAYLPDSLDIVGERLFPGQAPAVPALFVAAPGELIQSLKAAFDLAGVGLSVVEVKGVSILRALRALRQLPMAPTMLLEFGVDRVDGHYFQAGSLLFSHTLDLAPEKYGAAGGDWAQLTLQAAGAGFERMLTDLARQAERFRTFYRHMLRTDGQEDVRELWIAGNVPEPERVQAFLRRDLEGLQVRPIAPAAFQMAHAMGGLRTCSLAAIGAALHGGTDDAN